MSKLSKETEMMVGGCKIVLQIDSTTVHTSFGSNYIFLQAEKALESLMKNYVQFKEVESNQAISVDESHRGLSDVISEAKNNSIDRFLAKQETRPEPTELEKVAVERRKGINGAIRDPADLFEDLFKNGAKWLAEKLKQDRYMIGMSAGGKKTEFETQFEKHLHAQLDKLTKESK